MGHKTGQEQMIANAKHRDSIPGENQNNTMSNYNKACLRISEASRIAHRKRWAPQEVSGWSWIYVEGPRIRYCMEQAKYLGNSLG